MKKKSHPVNTPPSKNHPWKKFWSLDVRSKKTIKKDAKESRSKET